MTRQTPSWTNSPVVRTLGALSPIFGFLFHRFERLRVRRVLIRLHHVRRTCRSDTNKTSDLERPGTPEHNNRCGENPRGLTWFRGRRKATERGESRSSVWVQPLGLELRLLQSHLPLLHLPLQEVVIWLRAEQTGCEQYTAWKQEHDTRFKYLQSLWRWRSGQSHLNNPSHSRGQK